MANVKNDQCNDPKIIARREFNDLYYLIMRKLTLLRKLDDDIRNFNNFLKSTTTLREEIVSRLGDMSIVEYVNIMILILEDIKMFKQGLFISETNLEVEVNKFNQMCHLYKNNKLFLESNVKNFEHMIQYSRRR